MFEMTQEASSATADIVVALTAVISVHALRIVFLVSLSSPVYIFLQRQSSNKLTVL